MSSAARSRRLPLLVSGLLSVSIGNYGSILVSFLINILVARLLGPEEFGRLLLLLLVAHGLMVATAAWTLTPLVRIAAEEFAVSRSVRIAFWTRLVLVAPAVFLAVGASALLVPFLSDYVGVTGPTVWVAVVYYLASAMFQTLTGVLQAVGRMGAYGRSLVSERIVALFLVVLLAVLGGLETAVVLATFAVSALLVSAGIAWDLRQVLRPPAVAALRVREMLKFSLPFIGGTWAGVLSGHWIDLLIIRQILSTSDVGIYAIAFQLAGTVQQITVVGSTLLLPRLSALIGVGRHDLVAKIVDRIFPYWLLIYAVGVCAMLLGAAPLIPLLFGSGFAAAAPIVQLLLLASTAVAIFNSFNPLLVAYRIVWPVTAGVVVAVCVNVVLDLLLIPVWGLAGAAIATLLAYTLSTLVLAVAVWDRLGFSPGPIVLAASPALVGYLAVSRLEGFPLLIVLSLGIAISLTVVIRALHLFRRSDVGLLWAIDEAV